MSSIDSLHPLRPRPLPGSRRIALIGGLERHESEIQRRAIDRGCVVEFHRGHVGGRHAAALEAIVQRCDVAVIVTQVNSHGAMYITKRAAAKYGRPALVLRSGSPSSFSALLASIAAAPVELAAAGA